MAEAVRPRRTGLRKGIYILPNLFTSASLFSGFYGIVSSLKGHALATTLSALRATGVNEQAVESFQGGTGAVSHYYEVAAWAVLASALFDSMDGSVARLTNTQSEFGAEYDSLADLVAFGVGPAVLMYSWALEPFSKFGWMACFLYMACAALRLARFNVQSGDVEKKSFQGLPSPGAAAVVATTVLFYIFLGNWDGDSKPLRWLIERNVLEVPHWVFLAITLGAGLMMVSNVRYRSSKDLDPLKRVPLLTVLLFILVIMSIAAQPHIALFTIVWIYFLSGPVEIFLFYRTRKLGAKSAQVDLYADDDANGDDK
jgi:CDP-diacylglycerol--serine O-phosphatidyltransferase